MLQAITLKAGNCDREGNRRMQEVAFWYLQIDKHSKKKIVFKIQKTCCIYSYYFNYSIFP